MAASAPSCKACCWQVMPARGGGVVALIDGAQMANVCHLRAPKRVIIGVQMQRGEGHSF